MNKCPRTDRLNELLKREVADLLEKRLEHFKDCLVSVTEVIINPDLRHAKVLVSSIGPTDKKGTLLKLLRKNRAYLQGRIAKDTIMKYTPVLEFEYDSRMSDGDRVMSLIDELNAGDANAGSK